MECIDHDLDEIRKQRNHLQNGDATTSKGVRLTKRHRKPGIFWSKISRLLTLKVIAVWILLGTVAVIVPFMIATWIESNPEPAQLITDSIPGAAQKNATSTNSEVPAIRNAAQFRETPPSAASGQTSKEASIKGKPRQISFGTTTIPRDTTVIAAAATTSTASLRKPVRTASEAPASTSLGTDSAASKTTDIDRQDHVTNKQTAVEMDNEGRWVLNLISSSSKAGANRFADKARSKDIKTEQQQVTVKGKHYWRVQITGFSTATEASDYAGIAKEKLGLKDIWITTR